MAWEKGWGRRKGGVGKNREGGRRKKEKKEKKKRNKPGKKKSSKHITSRKCYEGGPPEKSVTAEEPKQEKAKGRGKTRRRLSSKAHAKERGQQLVTRFRNAEGRQTVHLVGGETKRTKTGIPEGVILIFMAMGRKEGRRTRGELCRLKGGGQAEVGTRRKGCKPKKKR